MPEVAYLSATGEIKVPLRIRTKLGLQAGEKFEVKTRGQNVVLQRLGKPSSEQVAEFIAWTRKHPRAAPIKLSSGPKRTRGRTARPAAKSRRRKS